MPPPLDPQVSRGPAEHDVRGLQADPGRRLGDQRRGPDGAQGHDRAGRVRLPRSAVRDHPEQEERSVRQPADRSDPAGRRAEVLRRLLQHAERAQPRAHDQRLLDGAVRRQGRHHRRQDLRPVPDAEEALPVRAQRHRPAGQADRQRLPGVDHGRRRARARRRTSRSPTRGQFYVGDIVTFGAVTPTGTKTVTAVPDATHITVSRADHGRQRRDRAGLREHELQHRRERAVERGHGLRADQLRPDRPPVRLRRLRRDLGVAGVRRDDVPEQGGRAARGLGQPEPEQAELGASAATSTGRRGSRASSSGASPRSARARARARSPTRSRTTSSRSATTTTIRTSRRITASAPGPGT